MWREGHCKKRRRDLDLPFQTDPGESRVISAQVDMSKEFLFLSRRCADVFIAKERGLPRQTHLSHVLPAHTVLSIRRQQVSHSFLLREDEDIDKSTGRMASSSLQRWYVFPMKLSTSFTIFPRNLCKISWYYTIYRIFYVPSTVMSKEYSIRWNAIIGEQVL